MLERDKLRGNALDRITELETRLEDLRDMSRPTEVIIYENPDWQQIAGWISTGTVLRSINGKIILDPGTPCIQIGAGGYIESEDFVAGTSGFQINGGVAEFNDVTIRGTIYATLGVIGGWTIGATSLSTATITLDAAVPSILLGDATDYNTGIGIWMGLSGGDYKMHIGDPAGDFLKWDGTDLVITGSFIGSTLMGGTYSTEWQVNLGGTDVDVILRLNRTTGGQFLMAWNGVEPATTNKGLKPNDLGINRISAVEPGTMWAGMVWLDAS